MKILMADMLYARSLPEIRENVSREARWVSVSPHALQEIEREISDADIFVGSKLPKSLIDAAKVLKLVICSASGTNGIAIDALPGHVLVTNTFHHEQSIAEHVMMSMIALSRGLLDADRALRDGRWKSVFYDSSRQPHRILAGQTVGLVGLGHMGTAIAGLARAFGMRVIAIRRTATSHMSSDVVDELRGAKELPWLLQNARFVVLCAPLTIETMGLVGQEQLHLMKADSFLINVARAEIVDEQALYEALRTKVIAGAALDVWYNYPKKMDDLSEPSRLPFKDLDNVIMTPHHSGQAQENFHARAKDVAYNVNAFLSGHSLINIVHR